ncbi:MAG: cytochrome c [Deltaproteobacteria bacterium]|nr:cytochrome c [Deltaproteobacteria bacterium]
MPVIALVISLIVASFAPQALAPGPEALVQEGKKLFENTCADCHRVNGQGLPDKFPALDRNPFVVGDPAKVIDTVLQGRKGKLGQMPTWKDKFNDQQVAAIITYVRQAWSNKGTAVTPEAVKNRRK